MDRLKEVLEKNKETYIERLKELIAIDTHDIGHGIGGGLEKEGQDYLVRLLEAMGADEITKDPMDEAVIRSALKSIRRATWATIRRTVTMFTPRLKGKKAEKAFYSTVTST